METHENEARSIACEMLVEYCKSKMKEFKDIREGEGGTPQVKHFFECMFLIRCAHEMEMKPGEGERPRKVSSKHKGRKKSEVPKEPFDVEKELLAASDWMYEALDLKNTDTLFGYSVEVLAEIPTGPWLVLLMNILIMVGCLSVSFKFM